MFLRLILTLLFFASATELITYRFSTSDSQAFYDYSGHDNHAVNGNSTLVELYDVNITSIGALFNRSRVALPANNLVSRTFSLGNSFSMLTWINPRAGNGTITEKSGNANVFKVNFTANTLGVQLMTNFTSIPLLSLAANTWVALGVAVKCGIFCSVDVYCNGALNTAFTVQVTFTDSGNVFILGDTMTEGTAFTGYIYDFHWFDQSSTSAVFGTYIGQGKSCTTGCTYCPMSPAIGCLSNNSTPTSPSCTSLGFGTVCETQKLKTAFYVGNQNCNNTCYTCYGPARLCDTCRNSTDALVNGYCVCPFGFYRNLTNLLCSVCNPTCATCSTSGFTSCTDCYSNAQLTSIGSCECTSGYYGSPHACVQCNQICSTCQGSAFNCTSCKANAMLSAANGTCTCLPGFYLDSALNCLPCSNSCRTCSGGSNQTCATCYENAQLESKAPSTCQCVPGFAPTPNLTNCTQCHPTCATCLTAASITSCLSCKFNAVLTKEWSCGCIPGSFPSPDASSCQFCTGPCAICTNSTICIQCKVNSVLINGNCTCDSGFFFSTDSKSCQSCNPSCLTCSSGSAAGCLTCSSLGFLVGVAPTSCACGLNAQMIYGNGNCTCLDGFYLKSTSLAHCFPCSDLCMSCLNGTSSGCTSCKSNAQLTSVSASTCTCSIGYYPSPTASNCTKCTKSCSSCTGPNACSSCAPGYYFVNQICVQCISGCLECTNQMSCVVCTSGMYRTQTEICKSCSTCSDPLTAFVTGPINQNEYNITFSRYVPQRFSRSDFNLTTSSPVPGLDWMVVSSSNLTLQVYGGPWTNVSSLFITFIGEVRDEFGFNLSTKTLVAIPPIESPTTLQTAPAESNDTSVNSTVSTAATVVITTIAGSGLIAGTSVGGGSLVMALLCQMQYFSYIGTANYSMSGNMNNFYTSLNQKSTLPNFFKRGNIPKPQVRRLDTVQELVLVTDFLDSSGQFLTLVIGIMAVHGLVYLLARYCGDRYPFLNRIKSEFVWNVYLYFWYFAYLDLQVSALFQLKENGLNWSDARGVICTILALGVLTSTFTTPFLMFYFMLTRYVKLFDAGENLTKRRCSSLVSNVRDDVKWAKYLYPVYYLQRLGYALLIVFLRDRPTLQCVLLILPCAIMAVFVLAARPLLIRSMRILHFLAELDTVLVFLLLCLTTLSISSTQVDMSWVILGLTLKSFSCTLLITLIGVWKGVKDACSRKTKSDAKVRPETDAGSISTEGKAGTVPNETEISFGGDTGIYAKKAFQYEIQPSENLPEMDTWRSDNDRKRLPRTMK